MRFLFLLLDSLKLPHNTDPEQKRLHGSVFFFCPPPPETVSHHTDAYAGTTMHFGFSGSPLNLPHNTDATPNSQLVP